MAQLERGFAWSCQYTNVLRTRQALRSMFISSRHRIDMKGFTIHGHAWHNHLRRAGPPSSDSDSSGPMTHTPTERSFDPLYNSCNDGL